MYLHENESRNKLKILWERAVNFEGVDMSNPDANFLRCYDQMAETEGVEIVTRVTDPFGPDSQSCGDYVFATELSVSWLEGGHIPGEIWTNPIGFLLDKGFNLYFEGGVEGDIVAYRGVNWCSETYAVEVVHWGLVRDGKVVSKWGLGHVFGHNLDMIPLNFGLEALFFRQR